MDILRSQKKSCMSFIPTRRSVLIFGYVNLHLSLLSVISILMTNYAQRWQREYYDPEYGHTIESLDLPKEDNAVVISYLTLTFIDILAISITIYGAHMRQWKFIRPYFYYGVISILIQFCLNTRDICNDIVTRDSWKYFMLRIYKWLLQIYLVAATWKCYKKMQLEELMIVTEMPKSDEGSTQHNYEDDETIAIP